MAKCRDCRLLVWRRGCTDMGDFNPNIDLDDDSACPAFRPRETPLLVDALGDAAKLLLEKMDNIGDGMLFNLDILDARELLRKAVARYKEEMVDE